MKTNQRGIENQPSSAEWLDADQAARLLGVKKATIYSYAAKGVLTALGGGGPGQRSRYRRAEVLRVKLRAEARAGHTAVAAGALRWGEPVLDSAITMMTPTGPMYRGHSAVELAKSYRFETVAELLWQGLLPPEVRWPSPRVNSARFVARTSALKTLTEVLALEAAQHQSLLGLTRERELELARQIVRTLAQSLGFLRAGRRVVVPANSSIAHTAATLLLGRKPTPFETRAVDTMLVLFADHELNASTFVARVAASAQADLFACLIAAMATLSGPRHGGACDQVELLLDDAARLGARQALERQLQHGRTPAGFDAGAYAGEDPRTHPLLTIAARIRPVAQVIQDTIRWALELTGASPAADFAQVVLCRALGLPRGSASALFALGRSAGWVAHILEQRESGAPIRPRARYVGTA